MKYPGFRLTSACAAAVWILSGITVLWADEPVIRGISPSAAKAGGAGFNLLVTGEDFRTDSKVQWGGAQRETTFLSSTQLRASIPSSDIATPGPVEVRVFTPDPDGGTSAAQTFTITTETVPVITSLLPASRTAGSGAFTLTVLGSGFNSSSQIRWNGSARTTTFFSVTTLDAEISASDVADPGVANLTVVNSTPVAATSNTAVLTVQTGNPAPVLTRLSPSFAVKGGEAFTLTVTGENFTRTSVIRWDGSDRETAYGSGTTLTAAIPASDLDDAGTVDVTVEETAPGGRVSNTLVFTIDAFSTLYFPQIAVGGGYTTVVTLINIGSRAAEGNIVLTRQAGTPLTVNIAHSGGTNQTSNLPINIPAGATRIFTLTSANAAEGTTSGSARVQTDELSLGGVSTFKLHVGGVLDTFAGVLPAAPVEAATILLDNSESQQRYTGFSIFNPGNENIDVRIVTVNANGSVLDTINPPELNPLGPHRQVTKFLHEYLPSRSSLVGSMVILTRQGDRFVPVALVLEKGIHSAVPVINGKPQAVPAF